MKLHGVTKIVELKAEKTLSINLGFMDSLKGGPQTSRRFILIVGVYYFFSGERLFIFIRFLKLGHSLRTALSSRYAWRHQQGPGMQDLVAWFRNSYFTLRSTGSTWVF